MAGGDHHTYKADPAIERWQNMHNTMYERFRFTPSKTRAIVLWGLVVPAIAYWTAAATDVSTEEKAHCPLHADPAFARLATATLAEQVGMEGPPEGESLLRKPPVQEEQSQEE